MFEFTNKGLWFDWSKLDAQDRGLAVGSLVSGSIGGLLIGFSGAVDFQRPEALSSIAVVPPLESWMGASGAAVAMIVAAALLALSAVLWWRFSLRQDEMFNRVQNYALGAGSALTLVIASLWWVLALGGWVAPPSIGWTLLIGSGLMAVLWLLAVRRWA